MSEDCKVCKNIERFYSTNKGRGRGGGRKTKVINKTVEPENIYIVICNNDVLRYTFSRKDAVTYMKELVSFQRIQYNPDYITHVEQCGDYMRIVGENRFFIISYQKVLSEFEVRCVKKIPGNTETLLKNESETESETESGSESGSESEGQEEEIVKNAVEEILEQVSNTDEDEPKVEDVTEEVERELVQKDCLKQRRRSKSAKN